MAIPKLKRDKKYLYTVEEYLAIERASEERYEYYDGEIRLMAGESNEHGIISVNLTIELGNQLKGTKCQIRTKDAKVKTGGFKLDTKSKRGTFSYPDLLVVCEEVKFHDEVKDIILNPKVIIEVLSDSTEHFDRTIKFSRYRMFNSSLTDYILISQDKPVLEHYSREEDGSWKLRFYTKLDDICFIKNINCRLRLKDIYDRIEFSQELLDFLKELKNG